MKIVIATALFVVVAYAEPPPPSHSYLPPSSRSQGGYPKGPAGITGGSGPQVIAARNLEGHGHGSHGSPGSNFARNSPHGHDHQGRLGNGDQGYDRNASPFGRNALEDANPEPANYNFGYMVNDYHEGTDFGHHEERQDERASGEYHVVLPDGRKQTVSYEADERGFKPQISYQDSEADGRSGYDSNANNIRSNGAGHNGHHDSGFGNSGGRSSHGNGRNGYN